MHASPYRFFLTSDGLRLRYGCWPGKPKDCRGTVVILGGRAEFMEKYLETIEEINGRGYDVFTFDWRGQGGSQRLLGDRTKGYVQSYCDYVSDLKQMLDEALSLCCPKPLYLLAHSMGGHIALRYLGQCAHPIAGGVVVAPMVGIHTAPMHPVALRIFCRWMVRMGRHGVVLPGSHRNDMLIKSFKDNRLTSDPVRFRRVQQIVVDQPQLAVAGVTLGWLAATFDAIEALHATGYVESIETPILLVLAGRDKVVSNAATLKLADKLPDNKVVVIPEARHEILQERDSLRMQFWRAFDLFVDG
jgi:lysophospholipase